MKNSIVINGWYTHENCEVSPTKEKWRGENISQLLMNELINLGYKDFITDMTTDVDEWTEDVDVTIPDCKLSLYISKEEIPLIELQTNLIRQMCGDATILSGYYGYSEWTILGYDVNQFTLGNHDILSILESHDKEYIYLIFEFEGLR